MREEPAFRRYKFRPDALMLALLPFAPFVATFA
jgi:hypothetical protein